MNAIRDAMQSLVDFVAAVPGDVLAGLPWVADHWAGGMAVVLGAVTVVASAMLHLSAWRRKG